MVKRPTRKAVNSRASTDTLNGNVRRRSSEQVKKDQEASNAAKAAEEWSINTAKRQKQMHIANLEDNLRKEDVFREKQSVHPDLQVNTVMYPKASLVLFGNWHRTNNVFQHKSTVTEWPDPEEDGLSYVDEHSDSEVVANEGGFLLFVPYSFSNHWITQEMCLKVWLTYLRNLMSTQKAMALG